MIEGGAHSILLHWAHSMCHKLNQAYAYWALGPPHTDQSESKFGPSHKAQIKDPLVSLPLVSLTSKSLEKRNDARCTSQVMLDCQLSDSSALAGILESIISSKKSLRISPEL